MITQTQTTARPLSYGLHGLIARFQLWLEARATRNALARLSDRQLDDIGLSRADIHRM